MTNAFLMWPYATVRMDPGLRRTAIKFRDYQESVQAEERL